jgi:hypothetical protein
MQIISVHEDVVQLFKHSTEAIVKPIKHTIKIIVKLCTYSKETSKRSGLSAN